MRKIFYLFCFITTFLWGQDKNQEIIIETHKKIEQSWSSNRSKLKDLYWQLGDAYYASGKKQKACQAWMSVLDITNLDWEICKKLALHLFKKNYYHESTEVLTTSLYLSLKAEDYFAGAKIAISWKNDQLAEKFLMKILQKHWPNEDKVIPDTVKTLLEVYARRREQYILAKNKPAITQVDRQIKYLKEGKRPTDIKIILTWDTRTDIDLWVTNPELQRCAYNQRVTFSGEKLHNDDTDGYGPETFTALKAKPGRYKIQVHFYGGTGVTQTKVVITLNSGSGKEKTHKYSVTLKKVKDLQLVTDLYIPQGE